MTQITNPELKHHDLTEKIIGIYFDVYNELGPGFLESVYEQCFVIALVEAGVNVQRQVPVPVWFRGRRVGEFRADILVERVVMVELKVASALDHIHKAQLMHYLKATDVRSDFCSTLALRPNSDVLSLRIAEKESAKIRVIRVIHG